MHNAPNVVVWSMSVGGHISGVLNLDTLVQRDTPEAQRSKQEDSEDEVEDSDEI